MRTYLSRRVTTLAAASTTSRSPLDASRDSPSRDSPSRDSRDLVALGLVLGADDATGGVGHALVRVGAAHPRLPRNAIAAPASSAAAAALARLNIWGRSLVVTTGSGGKP